MDVLKTVFVNNVVDKEGGIGNPCGQFALDYPSKKIQSPMCNPIYMSIFMIVVDIVSLIRVLVWCRLEYVGSMGKKADYFF